MAFVNLTVGRLYFSPDGIREETQHLALPIFEQRSEGMDFPEDLLEAQTQISLIRLRKRVHQLVPFGTTGFRTRIDADPGHHVVSTKMQDAVLQGGILPSDS